MCFWNDVFGMMSCLHLFFLSVYIVILIVHHILVKCSHLQPMRKKIFWRPKCGGHLISSPFNVECFEALTTLNTVLTYFTCCFLHFLNSFLNVFIFVYFNLK